MTDTMEIKLVVIAGIRSQFVKVAALQRGIQRWNSSSPVKIGAFYINSAQHYDEELSDSLIEDLKIHFDIKYSYQDRRPIKIFADMVVNIRETLDQLTRQSGFDWVVLFGDANTTLAAAVAASMDFDPIVHIEAGARSGNRKSPEERNRTLVDHLSAINFAASREDVDNLAREGITQAVMWTGDVLFDLVKDLSKNISPGYDDYSLGEYVLASIHHKENICSFETMQNILGALDGCQRRVVFATHPRTRKILKSLGNFRNINFVPSMPYSQMLAVLKGCAFVLTDSGGLQREAYYLRKRCLVRQDVPFWPCLTSVGVHKAVGKSLDDLQKGLSWVEYALAVEEYPVTDDLGQGNAVEHILRSIVDYSSMVKDGSRKRQPLLGT
jgi:UDP-GlcNAc3NAcA epimerase